MPYTAEHKRSTRARIVQSARELFNRKGFVEVSIDQIMARAGLTRGGFYSHFSNKEELFVEAIMAYRNFNPGMRWKSLALDPARQGKARARQLVDAYLSQAHLDDLEGHCPMIALPSDVARASPRVKQAYRELLEGMAGIFTDSLSADRSADARKRGLALAALCIGGMVLARTFEDESFRREVREAAHGTALELVDRRPASRGRRTGATTARP
ncbi:MAG: TetR/AcrR family transcriptional regulator [Frateuria sp.]|uniref:TetR/AcrR family transcriptional regulator n=1 Tax=Frateuria sp. TaxID=2211372 RepID=UPI0017FFD9AB|nr:TetR/AcrR family transcriptional regulator [Frateuria sp.]NUO71572.1 TetR/AcrR family transcriptional regulator [Frateuria sp.]NUR21504.1 TetR/AcrR family transcriptional regulator [Frateuria sp.]